MAEPLKNKYGAHIPGIIAGMISQVSSGFDSEGFVQYALEGYEALDLMARGRKIAQALRVYLPDDYVEAVGILVTSLGPKLDGSDDAGMAPFLYLPHTCFVAEYGLEHFEPSMSAQYELTQRFTAEFSIRPFLERYPDATLARLKDWTADPSRHVRRLVSEGTRPRLPWAPRLREFQQDPRPVLALLELLKDDPELYVRRSVANNLNDIGKDHPLLMLETVRQWMKDATDERLWLVRHALRSAVKRAESGALELLGYGAEADVSIENVSILPGSAMIGGMITIDFEITNTALQRQSVLVDLRVHFIKANGKPSPKVFKLKEIDINSQETVRLRKTISLAEMTTRKHYPGVHQVDVVLNGCAKLLGEFELAS